MDRSVWLLPLIFVFIMWFVYWAEVFSGGDFGKYGILPRHLKGLRGILLSPFLHTNLKHLYNNTIPLIVLMMMLRYFYRNLSTAVLMYGIPLTGFITWLIGRPSYHIGASGVIYLLVGFIFFSGVFRKYYRLVAMSLLVVFLYGGMIWYIFPVKSKISWEGHLAGFLTGLFLAVKYRYHPPYPETYHFERTEFDELFDEEGNFHLPDEENGDETNAL